LQTLLRSLKKHNLELSKLLSVVGGVAPCVIYSINVVAVLFSKRMQELSLENELIQYHFVILQQNLTGKVLGFKQIMADIMSAVKFIRPRGLNHRHFTAFLDEIQK
jgi:hypothetical protein